VHPRWFKNEFFQQFFPTGRSFGDGILGPSTFGIPADELERARNLNSVTGAPIIQASTNLHNHDDARSASAPEFDTEPSETQDALAITSAHIGDALARIQKRNGTASHALNDRSRYAEWHDRADPLYKELARLATAMPAEIMRANLQLLMEHMQGQIDHLLRTHGSEGQIKHNLRSGGNTSTYAWNQKSAASGAKRNRGSTGASELPASAPGPKKSRKSPILSKSTEKQHDNQAGLLTCVDRDMHSLQFTFGNSVRLSATDLEFLNTCGIGVEKSMDLLAAVQFNLSLTAYLEKREVPVTVYANNSTGISPKYGQSPLTLPAFASIGKYLTDEVITIGTERLCALGSHRHLFNVDSIITWSTLYFVLHTATMIHFKLDSNC
jgi:hypothetical protein